VVGVHVGLLGVVGAALHEQEGSEVKPAEQEPLAEGAGLQKQLAPGGVGLGGAFLRPRRDPGAQLPQLREPVLVGSIGQDLRDAVEHRVHALYVAEEREPVAARLSLDSEQEHGAALVGEAERDADGFCLLGGQRDGGSGDGFGRRSGP